MSLLDQLHNIVIHIQSFSDCMQEFLKLAFRMIPLDNHTRWNSWFMMLIVADKLESAIDLYIKNHLDDLEEDYLNSSDWIQLHTIMWFLEPFHQATLNTQEKYSRIDKVLIIMDILIKCFKKSLVRLSFLLLYDIY